MRNAAIRWKGACDERTKIIKKNKDDLATQTKRSDDAAAQLTTEKERNGMIESALTEERQRSKTLASGTL